MAALTASLRSAAEYLGQLAHRGAFDQYARYSPGEVVTDGGADYVNVAPVGDAPFMVDTFERQGASSWGTSESRHAWQTSNVWQSGLRPSIAGGVGILRATADSQADGQLWGPAQALGDAELLALLGLGAAGEAGSFGFACYLQAGEEADSYGGVYVAVGEDGGLLAALIARAPGQSDYGGAQVESDAHGLGALAWLRLRRVGQTYSARVWQQGAAEPAGWLVSHNVGYDLLAGHPLLQINGGSQVDTVGVHTVSVRALASATAPGSDSAHWAPLATALSLPQPQ